MTQKNNDGFHVVRPIDHGAKLRELNERLMAIFEHLRDQAPDSVEDVTERLKEEFGPDVLKDIYDGIPTKDAGEFQPDSREDGIPSDQDTGSE
jgi:hypothetical protein